MTTPNGPVSATLVIDNSDDGFKMHACLVKGLTVMEVERPKRTQPQKDV